jgi:hypothetical protein
MPDIRSMNRSNMRRPPPAAMTISRRLESNTQRSAKRFNKPQRNLMYASSEAQFGEMTNSPLTRLYPVFAARLNGRAARTGLIVDISRYHRA